MTVRSGTATATNDAAYLQQSCKEINSATPTPTPAFPLLVSRQADRDAPIEPNNQTLSGNAYIFVPAGTNIKQVSFWLDDPKGTGAPRRTESGAPYDFANGTATAANPLDTRTIANGQHAVTAELARIGGTKAVVTAAGRPGLHFGVVTSGVVPFHNMRGGLRHVMLIARGCLYPS